MGISVTFRVNPGGVSAADQRRVFDSLTRETQAELLSMSAADRSRVVCLVLFARLAGTTAPAGKHDPVGVSGQMWGSQRAY